MSTPKGAYAVIRFDDAMNEENVYISFGTEVTDEKGDPISDSYGIRDENIFFYSSPKEEKYLRSGSEGWTLLSWEFSF